MMKIILTRLLPFAVLGILFPLSAFAATGLSIQPLKIDQTLSPGQTFSGQILLQNASDAPVDIAVSVEDFVPNPGADSIQFVARAPGVTSVEDWIKISADPSFPLGVNEQKVIPYTITAPANAEPGGHFGVLLFKATPQTGAAGSLKVGVQVGMIVLIAIPGSHLEKGNILSFTAPAFQQHGPVPFSINFQNTGTVFFEPTGSIVITNMFGQKVGEVPVTGQIVLPTSVRKLSFFWNAQAFSIGHYTAVATLYDGQGNVLTTRTLGFWIVPIWYLVGFLLVLILIYVLIRYIKSHVRISVVK